MESAIVLSSPSASKFDYLFFEGVAAVPRRVVNRPESGRGRSGVAEGLEPGADDREADEFMEVHTLRWSEAMRMARVGEIADGKTLSGLLFVQCFKR